MLWPPAKARVPRFDGGSRQGAAAFLNDGWSPFVARRETPFQAEDVAREFINDRAVGRILESQPIPIIGIPWYQIAHLPDILVLLHETGHMVEADFLLKGQLAALLKEALNKSGSIARQRLWAHWLPEVFANLYGCLTGGPTYVDTLLDFLVDSRENSENEKSTERNNYPSASLRVLLAAAALDELEFGEDAERIRAEWILDKDDTIKREALLKRLGSTLLDELLQHRA